MLDVEADHEDLKMQLEDLLNQIKELEDKIINWQDEVERLKLEEEERRRLELEARKNQPVAAAPVVAKKYKMVKGDAIDEMMAMYIDQFNLDVPFYRISEGVYMFGTKRITAKIMNGKLVVRVGGGYMLIEEFLQTYGQ